MARPTLPADVRCGRRSPDRLARPIAVTRPLFDGRDSAHGRMTQQHPELADEQAYVDHAYECLERTRASAWRLRDLNEADLGGTFQARFERNAFDEALVKRLTDLDLGDAALVFGRIDRYAETPGGDRELPHRPPRRRRRAVRAGRRRLAGAGRRAVLPGHRPRADGPRPPPPLRRRGPHAARHRGRAVRRRPPRRRPRRRARAGRARRRPQLRGYSTLLAALERGPHRHARRHRRHDPGRAGRDHPLAAGRRARRAGRPGHRQDRRRPAPRRLPAVHPPLPARGPGRARHRAEPGVPALHRAGAAVARRGRRRAGRARRPRARRALRPARATPATPTLAARVKGDARMSEVIDKAVARPRAPAARRPAGAVPHRVRAPHRRASRRASSRPPGAASAATTPGAASSRARCSPRWPRRGGASRSPPARCARRCAHAARGPRRARADVAGADARPSCSTTCSARRRCCASPAPACSTDDEIDALHRPRAERRRRTCAGPPADVALLDDAREVLGPRLGKGGKVDDADEIRTYGHIVIDEVQDLTPMQLKMAARRSLNGSLTVVGDLAQATGPLAPDTLGRRARPPARAQAGPGRRAVGRLPHPGPDHGARRPGDARRDAGAALADAPCASATPRRSIVRAPSAAELGAAVAEATAKMTAELTQRQRRRRRPRRASSTRSPPRSPPPASSTGGRPAPASTTRSPSCRSAWSRASSSTASSSSSRRGSSATRSRACARCTSRSPGRPSG